MGKSHLNNQHLSRNKQNRQKNGPSKNKYAHLVPKKKPLYEAKDKTFRDLPTLGKPGEIIRAGLRQIFHGRVYVLQRDVTILPKSIVPGLRDGKSATMGSYKLLHFLD